MKRIAGPIFFVLGIILFLGSIPSAAKLNWHDINAISGFIGALGIAAIFLGLGLKCRPPRTPAQPPRIPPSPATLCVNCNTRIPANDSCCSTCGLPAPAVSPAFAEKHLQHLNIPRENLLFNQGPVSLPPNFTGILFVYAEWSAASILSFRTLNNLLTSNPAFATLPLLLLNTDDPDVHTFQRTFPPLFHGNGETAFVHQGILLTWFKSCTPVTAPEILPLLTRLTTSTDKALPNTL